MSFRIDLPRKFLVNAFKNQQEKAAREKFRKKGLLTKIFQTNRKKSNALVEILRESDTFNTLSSYDRLSNAASSTTSNGNDQQASTQPRVDPSSNEQFLKKFRSTQVG